MFSILSISEASVIAKILAFFEQLNIICTFFLQLKHLLSFMSRDISVSKFRDVGVIVPQSVLDIHEKKVLLLDTISAWEELVIVLKEILVIVCTIVEDLVFSLIQLVACICL